MLSTKTVLNYAKMECKNGVKRELVSYPWSLFNKDDVLASLSSKPVKNTKNQPLGP